MRAKGLECITFKVHHLALEQNQEPKWDLELEICWVGFNASLQCNMQWCIVLHGGFLQNQHYSTH
jgi:hypothetical protein